MSVIGYIRVSSAKQTLEHQRFEIEQYAKKHKLIVDDWVFYFSHDELTMPL